MNYWEEKYKKYYLIKDIFDTVNMVKNLDIKQIVSFSKEISKKHIFISGEGSSRIFPAKRAMYDARKNGYEIDIFTDCATQALEYNLSESTVFIASNSGKTKEDLRLIRKLKHENHHNIIGIVANPNTPVMQEANLSYLLTCGKEKAVAATKSVIEQSLFYDLLFKHLNNISLPDLRELGNLIQQTLEISIKDEILEILTHSNFLYFSGRNNGVAEELTLKSNEIARKKSIYLEGTYIFHGIEEVMDTEEAVILIDPFEDEEEMYRKILVEDIGLNVVAISSRETIFPTIIIPDALYLTNYIELTAGWNLLVEIGLNAGINLDQTLRARKVDYEEI